MQDDTGSLVCRRCLTDASGRVSELRLGRAVADSSRCQPAARGDRGSGRTAGRDGHRRQRFAADCDVLIGTEAVLHRAASADVVAFLDLDAELLAPRYRAGEQAMALLARAARLVGGRAGGGRLLVQTFLPRHEVLQAVLHADPIRFAKVEMSRREMLQLPPFAALAAVSGAGARSSPQATGLESSSAGDVVLLRAPTWDELGAAIAAHLVRRDRGCGSPSIRRADSHVDDQRLATQDPVAARRRIRSVG